MMLRRWLLSFRFICGVGLIGVLAACSPNGAISPSVQETVSSISTRVPGQVSTRLPGLETRIPGFLTTQLPGAMSTLAAVPVTGLQFDQSYIDMMVPLHQAAVDLAQMAQQRAEHQELKDWAGQVISERQAEITKLKGWKQQWYSSSDTPPLSQVPMIQGQGMNLQLANLQSSIDSVKNTSAPFDQALIDAIIPQYQAAIAATQLAQTTVTHTELKALAQQMLAEEEKEMNELDLWRTTWFGAPAPLGTPTPSH
jgi:uncharacterized protein (DUF305 family)